MNYALITGASKGIGKAIAIEAANRGMNLLLVARSKELLEVLAKELGGKVKVEIFATDLLQDDAPQKIFGFAKERGLEINMLINNAGIGLLGDFDECELQKHLDIMKLNMDVCVKMTHTFLKLTNPEQRRYILNVVSTGAFQPVPHMSIYAATKAFMLFFTRALRVELKKKNVYVTALCPGPTESEFFALAQMTELVEKNAHFMMSADKVARAGMNAVMKNKSIIIPGFLNKLGAIVVKLAPHNIVIPSAGKIYE